MHARNPIDNNAPDRSDERARIEITGDRRKGRFLILVNEHSLWLPYSAFYLLILLAARRDDPASGGFVSDPARTYPVAVHRLRKAFDDTLGERSGHLIVETGVMAEYRLAPVVEVKLRSDASFHPRLIETKLAERLKRACRIRTKENELRNS